MWHETRKHGSSELQHVHRTWAMSKENNQNWLDDMKKQKTKEKRNSKNKSPASSQKAMRVTQRVFTQSNERVTAARIVEWQKNCCVSGSIFFFLHLCVSSFLLAKIWLQVAANTSVRRQVVQLAFFMRENKEKDFLKKKGQFTWNELNIKYWSENLERRLNLTFVFVCYKNLLFTKVPNKLKNGHNYHRHKVATCWRLLRYFPAPLYKYWFHHKIWFFFKIIIIRD